VSLQEAIELGIEPALHEDALRRLEGMPGGDESEAEA
jgi:hypothetical protein